MDDDKPETTDEGLEEETRRRRRPPRSWSTGAASTERFDRPLSETAWGWQQPAAPTTTTPPPPPGAPASTSPAPVVPPPPPAPSPSSAPTSAAAAVATRGDEPDGGPLGSLLDELRDEFSQLRDALSVARQSSAADGNTIVSGAELAAVIEGLGVSLGNGMATLLSDHRSLLARDIEAGSDRVLEDIGRRLRTSTNQMIDGVEAKVRHLTSQNQAVVADQIDARMDQLQGDISGIRAVMLELPDQTEVISRLDRVSDDIAETNAERIRESVTNKVPPALLAALEEALTEPMARLEEVLGGATEQLLAASEAQRAAAIGSIDGENVEADAQGMARLTQEIVALRRRVGLRADAPAVELSDAQLDAIAERVAARLADPSGAAAPKPAARSAKAPAKAPAKAAPARRRRNAD